MNAAWSLFAVLAAATGGDPTVTPLLNPDAGVIVLTSGRERLEVSLRCPHVRLDNEAGSFGGELPTKIDRRAQADGGWECSYQPVKLAGEAVVDRVLRVEWSAREGVLRKWLRLRLTSGNAPVKIDEIVLETLDASKVAREFRPGPPQSYPGDPGPSSAMRTGAEHVVRKSPRRVRPCSSRRRGSGVSSIH
jgi:hypothetical protein